NTPHPAALRACRSPHKGRGRTQAESLSWVMAYDLSAAACPGAAQRSPGPIRPELAIGTAAPEIIPHRHGVWIPDSGCAASGICDVATGSLPSPVHGRGPTRSEGSSGVRGSRKHRTVVPSPGALRALGLSRKRERRHPPRISRDVLLTFR